MRPFVKYVSLLLFSSGLIFSSYFGSSLKSPAATPVIVKRSNPKQPNHQEKAGPQYFSFQQIIEFAIPALKK